MYTLPELSYSHEGLAPVVSALTMHTHHGKHHQAYLNVVNEATGTERIALEDLILRANRSGDRKLFNSAAQSWNHAFFWESMTPASSAPTGEFLSLINQSFGNLAGLRKEFVSKGLSQFGSGWVWLAATDSKLQVVTTHDAGVPWLDFELVPLLVCDVWEHAYYLDYRNERDRFLGSFFDQLANWQFAARQLAGGAAKYRFPLPT